MCVPRDENKKSADDPLDAIRDDAPDAEADTDGQEALAHPEKVKPGQRRVVEDDD